MAADSVYTAICRDDNGRVQRVIVRPAGARGTIPVEAGKIQVDLPARFLAIGIQPQELVTEITGRKLGNDLYVELDANGEVVRTFYDAPDLAERAARGNVIRTERAQRQVETAKERPRGRTPTV